ncbi:MAG: hypothetical protein FWH11_06960 [Micrococcales bacterium]|nr:hypothetical protein [Micrococcales bacterium]
MKRTMAAVLAAAVMSALTGCGVSLGDGAKAPETTAVTVSEPSSASGSSPDEPVPSAEPSDAKPADAKPADVKSLLKPSGATVAMSLPGEMLLMASDSFDVLTTFYGDALAQLGAQEDQAATVGTTWVYYGTYDGGKSIKIAVLGSGGAEYSTTVAGLASAGVSVPEGWTVVVVEY